MVDYRIEGQLILNSTEFNTTLENATTRLNRFIASFKNLNGAESELTELNNKINNLEKELKELQLSYNQASDGAKRFTNDNRNVGNVLNENTTKTSNAVKTNRSLSLSYDSASKSAITYRKSVQGLTSALNTLRTVSTLFISMYAYRFVDAIGRSAKATISAKSEMESYFRVLKMSITEQAQFNDMLEKTLAIYPKMNKYQLGETISSLGVEFGLDMKQMQKIADTAPMVINEYLRAGRSTEEAILAIKDISQGEFLRLSRETGVGQEELVATGLWEKGDFKDIEGIYNALEAVGKSRHWDRIAQKATSLSDVLLITENRFGEFATDLTTRITPHIVGGFNKIIDAIGWLHNAWNNLGAGGQFTASMGGLGALTSIVALNFRKLNSSIAGFLKTKTAFILGIDEEIAATKGLGAAVAQQVFEEKAATIARETAINSYNSETFAINSTIIAHELDTDARRAKVLAIQAENLAQEKSISVDEARILVIEREKMAQMSSYKVIMTKVLGLKAEETANYGLKTAIVSRIGLLDTEKAKVMASKAASTNRANILNKEKSNLMNLLGATRSDTAATNVNTSAKIGNDKSLKSLILTTNLEKRALFQSRMATLEKTSTEKLEAATTVKLRSRILAKILAVNAETLANEGATNALIEKKIAQKLAAGVALEEATATAMAEMATWGLVASIVALAAPIIAVAALVTPLIIDFNNMSNSFQKASDTISNGQTEIDELKGKQKAYQKTVDSLSAKTKLSAKESDKLAEARKGLKDTTDALKGAEEKYAYAQQISNTYTKSKNKLEGERYRNLKKINEELNKQKGTSGEQYVDNTYGMGTAAKKSYEAQQNAVYLEEHRISNWDKIEASMKRAGKSEEEINQYMNDYNNTLTDAEEAWLKIADPNVSGWDKLYAYWDLNWTKIKRSWIDFWANPFENIDKPLDVLLAGTSLGNFLSMFTDGHAGEALKKGIEDTLAYVFSPNESKPYNIDKLLSISEEGIKNLGDDLWNALDAYLSNHVPMYGWIKKIMPSESEGEEAGNGLFDGFKTGIAPIDNLIRDSGDNWASLSNLNGQKVKNNTGDGLKGISSTVKSHLDTVTSLIPTTGNKWHASANTSGGKIKTGVKTGSNGTSAPVKSEIDDISSSLKNAAGTWWGKAFSSAKSIIRGITAGLNRHSPGDAAETIKQEMIDAGVFIDEQQPTLFGKALTAGQSIVSGFQSMDLGNQLSNTLNNVDTNSNNVIGMNQATLTNTTNTYNQLGAMVNTTFTGINQDINTTGAGVSNSLNRMNTSVKTNFDIMSKNTDSSMKNASTSNQKYLDIMSLSTLSTTKNMVSAWNTMSTHIVSSAKYIRNQSYSKFNSLHKSISSFYNQLASAKFSAGALAMGGSELSRGKRLSIGRLGSNTGGRIRMSNHISKPRLSNNVYGTNKSFKEAHHNRIMNTAYPWEIGDPWFLGIRIPMNNRVRDFKNGNSNVRISSANFEEILRDILTARGFANPGTYEYYANSKRSNQQVWDQVRCNCYDGAEMIVEIGQMLGLGGHLVHGSWKGEGHMGAMVGGKLYDMTQFQKRGVFRGTSGVSFGTRGNSSSHGSNDYSKKETHFNFNVDLSNAHIYGIDDLDKHIEESAEKAFYKFNEVDRARGY